MIEPISCKRSEDRQIGQLTERRMATWYTKESSTQRQDSIMSFDGMQLFLIAECVMLMKVIPTKRAKAKYVNKKLRSSVELT